MVHELDVVELAGVPGVREFALLGDCQADVIVLAGGIGHRLFPFFSADGQNEQFAIPGRVSEPAESVADELLSAAARVSGRCPSFSGV
ncbi:hypothetical protein [Nocardia asteroides]|uniref:hypothetical protein n=1 Tax=Nocardia asteroides TaxID=1824 RepID=UPI0033C2FD1B